MIKGVIFDLDGTLLNTLTDLKNAVNFTMKKYGFEEITLKQTREYVGNGVRNLLIRASKQENNIEEMYKTFKEYYDIHNADNIYPYEGIMNLVESLQKEGYKMAIVSNKYQKGVEEICKPIFSKYIDVYIGSRDDVKNKPDRALVDIALNALNIKDTEAIYVGDSEVDILTAKNANMKCISVSWGYRDLDVLVNNKALFIVKKPDEILKIIKEN